VDGLSQIFNLLVRILGAKRKAVHHRPGQVLRDPGD
jgi:hypothetical protein